MIMMENSTYYAMNGELGQLFRQFLCDHLQVERPKATDMARLIHINLAAKIEVLIRCDIFYNMGGYTAITGDTEGLSSPKEPCWRCFSLSSTLIWLLEHGGLSSLF
jgi:hypothetical protein